MGEQEVKYVSSESRGYRVVTIKGFPGGQKCEERRKEEERTIDS